jgi:Glyoxalase-like domain
MSTAVFDHLVIACATLEQGVRWCESTLGVAAGPGGRHAAFGTHNRLVKLDNAVQWPLAFVELIAIDPEAPAPGRPRWFDLDNPVLQARLHQNGPQLVHWVARSTMLDMHRWGLITIGLQPGDPVRAGRDTPRGRLEWQILVRADGVPLAGGALPTLIQWPADLADVHPAAHLPTSGLALTRLQLRGVPPRAREVLRLRGVQHAEDTGPALEAEFATPSGPLTLASPL